MPSALDPDEGIPSLVLRSRLLARIMGLVCVIFGLFLLVGGVSLTVKGDGLDNLIVAVAALVFVAVGGNMWWARVVATEKGIRVQRLWRSQTFTRAEIEGIEVGTAVGMMVAGQRTVIVAANGASVPLNVLARYATPGSELLLTQQRDSIKAALGFGRG